MRGFPLDAKEHEIFDFFNRISRVDRVLIAQNAKLQKFRGFAYIVLKNKQAYDTALAHSEGLVFRGHELSISESKSKDQVDKEKRSSINSQKKSSTRNSEVTADTIAKFSSTDSTGVLEERERLSLLLESPLYNNQNSRKLCSPNRKRNSLNRQSNSFEPYNNFSSSQREINCNPSL